MYMHSSIHVYVFVNQTKTKQKQQNNKLIKQLVNTTKKQPKTAKQQHPQTTYNS